MNYRIDIICTYKNKFLIYESITETVEEEHGAELFDVTYIHREVYCWRRR